MIRIGDFTFPQTKTALQVRMIEAKSKVRKEIQIRSFLKFSTQAEMDDARALLQSSVEAFDRHEAHLSLQPGRYYLGRRRNFQVESIPRKPALWVDLLIFTDDRFERGTLLHHQSKLSFFGTTSFSLFNAGNWQAPLLLRLTPEEELQSIEVTSAHSNFSLIADMMADETVLIDAENQIISQGEANLLSQVNGAFPTLASGGNQLVITTTPNDVDVACQVSYRDVWV